LNKILSISRPAVPRYCGGKRAGNALAAVPLARALPRVGGGRPR